ncbi:low temperature requirement protein A [Gordonia sp. SID5947]|uniref:low temperature requirement protein A n=1 Tax=Gordonia sp. SID5947 TaxID=2690315 RepID=UPI001926DFF6|nr:low temperature requirement protein A [Gordonia sp. SID5947]
MTGRDPHEEGRAATSLELFYDLVFVVAFSTAGTQVAHQLAEGHYQTAIFAYLLCTFAAIWAWINFAWFASAFDTDDWFFRVVTLVQMVGVAIIALGIPPVFESLAQHDHVDNRVLVIGYIVMRVGMVAQWVRVAVQSELHRRSALLYAGMTLVAQIGWVGVLIADMSPLATLFAMLACVAVELVGPFLGERTTTGTPWHPHHIAERYSLLTIITLGEGVVGTVAVLGAVVEVEGWSVETAVLGLAGMGVTFAMWWMYFIVPVGDALQAHREKSFGWGYGHILIFMAAAAVGAGLHVAALYIEHETHIGPGAVVATLAVPLGVYCLGLLAMYDYLLPFDPMSMVLALGAVAVLAAGVWLAATGVSVVFAVVVTALAPVMIVVIDEIMGVPRRAEALAAIGMRGTDRS